MLTLISGYPNPNFDLYPGEDMDMIVFVEYVECFLLFDGPVLAVWLECL